MKTKLSALLDGELEREEAALLFASLRGKDELHDCCRFYPLIGDALRGESGLGTDITANVMMRLTQEPTQEPLLLRAPRLRRAWPRPLLAMAASLAGVAVVVWLTVPQSQGPGAPVLAKTDSAAIPIRMVPARDMQEYVVAHQAQSANLQFQGGTEHIRTVSLGYGK